MTVLINGALSARRMAEKESSLKFFRNNNNRTGRLILIGFEFRFC